MSKGVQKEPEWLCCEVAAAAGAAVVAGGFEDVAVAVDCFFLAELGFAAAPAYEGLAGL